MNTKSLLAGILMVAFLVAASASAAETVSVSGSTTVMPVGVACAEAFNAQQDEIQVTVTGGGSGAGIKNVATGLSDIGMASREVKESEIEEFGEEFVATIVSYDAVCVAVSQEIYDGGVVDLSIEDVAAIYNGEITNWADLGGPEEEIYVLARMAGSGTRDTFNELVLDDDEAETPGVMTFVGSNAEMKTAVTNSEQAIGYMGLGYAQEGVGVLALEGVSPSADTIADGSYSLARSLYMYTFGEPSDATLSFMEFILGEDGQAIVEDEGFIPVVA